MQLQNFVVTELCATNYIYQNLAACMELLKSIGSS